MTYPRQIVLETLAQRGPLTLAELARALECSPLTLRYHLGILVADGLIVPSAVTRRARVGRPATVYALTARAHAYLPHQYDWLALQLLDELARTDGERALRATLRRIGQRLAKAPPLPRAQTRWQTRVVRAVEFLCTRGYAARLDKSNGEWLIRVHHCPYQKVALHQRAVCELDLALIGALVQTALKMTQCLARQDAECVFALHTATLRK